MATWWEIKKKLKKKKREGEIENVFLQFPIYTT
jgi:hypothetical protein